MIDAKEVKEYIEKKTGKKLTPMQYRILKAIIRGDEIYTPRGIGRSFLYNGYANYLQEIAGKDVNRKIDNINDFDSVFTIDEAVDEIEDEKEKIKVLGSLQHFQEYFPEAYDREYKGIIEKPHTCQNCKYCHCVDKVEYHVGVKKQTIISWCEKDGKNDNKKYLNSYSSCDYFEEGPIRYE